MLSVTADDFKNIWRNLKPYTVLFSTASITYFRGILSLDILEVLATTPTQCVIDVGKIQVTDSVKSHPKVSRVMK